MLPDNLGNIKYHLITCLLSQRFHLGLGAVLAAQAGQMLFRQPAFLALCPNTPGERSSASLSSMLCSHSHFPRGSLMVRQESRHYPTSPELQGLEQHRLRRWQQPEVDLRCTCEQGTPSGSISLQAEVMDPAGALGWWSHPLAVGCCLCHSCLLRASGTNQPRVWEENNEQKNKGEKEKGD